MTMTDWESRLRRALAGTSEDAPRPMSRLELPFNMDKLLLTPALMKSLRPAAVLAPIVRRGRELTLLFTVRADHLRSHKGQISFPGGRRDEEDASVVANALREAEEEIGLPPANVEVLGYLDDYPTITRYLVTPVVGLVSGEPEIKPHEGEVAEVFEAPLDYVLDLRNFERKLLSNEGLNVPFFEVNYGRHRIWGATAGMLWNLANKVAQA
ncbi:MAG TPA: CoA pyrophosphatase [Solimonas sp.]|nr:CoA pyrophosphatase [Solimonas sp.]